MYKIFEVVRVYMMDLNKDDDRTNEVETIIVEDDDMLNIVKWLVEYGISGFRGSIDSIINLRNTLEACDEVHSVIDEYSIKISNGSYVKVTKEYKIVKES